MLVPQLTLCSTTLIALEHIHSPKTEVCCPRYVAG